MNTALEGVVGDGDNDFNERNGLLLYATFVVLEFSHDTHVPQQ